MTVQTDVADERIKEQVRSRYGRKAQGVLGMAPAVAGCCGSSAPIELLDGAGLEPASFGAGCCAPATGAAADEQGYADRLYSPEELSELPESVTGAALGCGNPTAIAGLKPGQVVLDLGSGGGIDCFLAARQVGSEGRVVGLDMTAEMIELAQRNKAKLGPAAANVTFQLGEMESIPLADASVDVIISNCVINLSPDKDAVFREAYRVLRPGGYLAVSDIVALRPLPTWLTANLAAWAGCVAGALDVETYEAKLRAAGFAAVEIAGLVPTDFGAADGMQGTAAQVASKFVPGGIESWIASARVTAFKR